MSKESKLVIAIFLIVFLSSCAATGALIGAGGTLYGLHKEAKTHYPEKVPDLPELPTLPDLPDFLNMFNLNGDNALKKSSQNESTEYGFDCTKQKTSTNQTECFDRFIKPLLKSHNQEKANQKKIASKAIGNIKAGLNTKKSKIVVELKVSI